MNPLRCLAVFALASVLLHGSNAQAAEDMGVFAGIHPGEVLEYSLGWGPFSVGEGVLSVQPDVEVDGIPCHHLCLTAKSNSFADAFYKVRNEYHSYIDKDKGRVIRYRIQQHEGRTQRDAEVRFDWENLTATYQQDGKPPRDPVVLNGETWDPLSVVFRFRSFNAGENETVVIPTTDGKKLFAMEISVVRPTETKVPAGTYSTILVRPDTKDMKGVFEKSKNSKINMWYTTDAFRYPVLIKSKVIVGSFRAELKNARRIETTATE